MNEKAFLGDEESKKLIEKKKKIEAKQKKDASEVVEKKRKKKLETEENLAKLKEVIEDGYIENSTFQAVENIATDGIIDSEEIKEILQKIDEIHNNPKISRYLPSELIITKSEYLAALQNTEQKKETLKKVEQALENLALQVGGAKIIGFNLFASLALILDRNLVLIQENHIDIKRSLIS